MNTLLALSQVKLAEPVNKFAPEPYPICVAVSVSGVDATLSVVPVNERFVPNVISSITPVPAVARPINLFVVTEVLMLGVAPPDEVNGKVAVTFVTPPAAIAVGIHFVPSN